VVTASVAERGRHHPAYVGGVGGQDGTDLHGPTITEGRDAGHRVSDQ